jgi:SAM-dependent methyltransferase
MSEPQTVSPARSYEDYFVPAIFGPLTDVVLGQAPPRPGEAVVDVACGTGVVARRAARIAGDEARIVGVDRSPAMLEVARVEAQREGLSIDWHVGDAMALDLPDASFEVACCQQGLQFLPDRTRGAAQLRRVLTEGGRAAVAVWQGLGRHPLFAALAEAEVPNLARFGVPVTYDDAVAPFSFGDPDDLGSLLDGVGFGASR